MVGVQGFEPWTPWSQTRCASQTAPHSEYMDGLLTQLTLNELLIVIFHTTLDWYAVTGSNRRQPACKAGTLPTELTAQNSLLNLFNLYSGFFQKRCTTRIPISVPI